MDRGSVRWGRVLTVVFVAAALLFAGLLLFGQWRELQGLRAEIAGWGWRLAPGWLAAALAAATFNLFLMGGAWVRLYRGAGGTVSYRRGVSVWVATNLGRYIPGKVWHLSGLALHLRRTGESGALALTTALTFQVVTLLTGSAVALGTLGGDTARIPGGSPVVAGLVLILLVGLLHPRVIRALTRLAARFTREELDGVGAARGRDLAAAAALLAGAWAVYGMGFWCLLEGVSHRGAPAGPVLLTGVFAASYVAGYLVLVVPGGLGVREGAMTALLAALTPAGAAVAGALAVAARVWNTVSELAGLGAAAALTVPARARPGDGEGEGPAGDARPGGRP